MPRITVPDGPFDPRTLAPGAREVWLEIGFGGGEHLVAQAARNPDILILGAEPFVNGVASALRHIEEAGVENVRLHAGDARDLMARLADGAVDRLFILFPDPWPKFRHHKRRLVNEEFLDEAARVTRPGGRLRFATDWADYADQVLTLMPGRTDFTWTAEKADDWRLPPADHVATRYEEKRLGDCAPIWLELKRI